MMSIYDMAIVYAIFWGGMERRGLRVKKWQFELQLRDQGKPSNINE